MSVLLTVESLAGGGAVERLHKALQEVLENILDPNTPAKKPRKAVLELIIKPNEQRNMGEMTISTKTTLCAPEPIETSIFIDTDKKGKAVASERVSGESPGQQPLMEEMHPDGKIATIQRRA